MKQLERSKEIIHRLSLSPHCEGGYFSEIYQSQIKTEGALHSLSTIYYLLSGEEFSAFHRLESDEVWFLHEGKGLIIHQILPDGEYKQLKLSLSTSPQVVCRKGVWFAAETIDKTDFGFVSCVVVPAFDYQKFHLAKREELTNLHPQHKEVIERLTRE